MTLDHPGKTPSDPYLTVIRLITYKMGIGERIPWKNPVKIFITVAHETLGTQHKRCGGKGFYLKRLRVTHTPVSSTRAHGASLLVLVLSKSRRSVQASIHCLREKATFSKVASIISITGRSIWTSHHDNSTLPSTEVKGLMRLTFAFTRLREGTERKMWAMNRERKQTLVEPGGPPQSSKLAC